MPAKSKIVNQVSSVALVRDSVGTFGSTTLTAAEAAGGNTLTVAGITNFAIGDIIRVGEGEEMELIQVHASTAPTGTTITLATNLVYAHANGAAVVEQTAWDLGDITDGGVSLEWTGEATDIFVATKRLVFAVLNGYVSAQAKFALPGMSLYNIAAATGSLQSLVAGAGTAASPLQYVSDGSDFGGAANMSLIIQGVLIDGTIIRCEMWGVDADYTGISMALARGTLSPVPCVFTAAAGGIIQTAAGNMALSVANRPSKGDVFDALTSVGFFTDDAAGSDTVASGGAAGASTVVLNSGTGFLADDWVRFGAGDTMEIWQLEDVTTNTLTIRGKFYRQQAVGAVAETQAQTQIAGIAPEGVTVAIGGTVEQLRSALSRTSIGSRAGQANVSFAVPMIETSLSNFARALGIPQAAISGGKLPFNGANLATDTLLNGMFCTGTVLDGRVLTAMFWGTSIDLSGVATVWNNTGAAAITPITVKPSSGFALLTV